jgi:hypothetical protein
VFSNAWFIFLQEICVAAKINAEKLNQVGIIVREPPPSIKAKDRGLIQSTKKHLPASVCQQMLLIFSASNAQNLSMNLG